MELEALDKLHLVHARLLFIISEMHNSGRITDDEKLKWLDQERAKYLKWTKCISEKYSTYIKKMKK